MYAACPMPTGSSHPPTERRPHVQLPSRHPRVLCLYPHHTWAIASKPCSLSPPHCFPSSTSPAAPRQAMLSTSHQAKRHRSCRLMLGFASSECVPSSCCWVSKHQSAEPWQGCFANGCEPPAESSSISSTVSTRATPRTSLTKPMSTSPSPPACRRRLPTARLRHCGQRPVSSHRFRLWLKSAPHRFLVLLRPTPTPWPPASHRIRPVPPRAMVPLPPMFCCGAARLGRASPSNWAK
jgi:hypothetical protein